MESTVKVPKTCDEMRDLIGQFLKRGDSEAQRLWDIITCQRGPDHPSEDGTMANDESSAAYQARRKRKRDTVEVIRAKSWGGVVGGAARFRTDIDYVTVEPPNEQDHFARHVVKAAGALGLEVKYKRPKTDKGLDVPVQVGYSGETSGAGVDKMKSKYATFTPTPKYNFPLWALEVNPIPLKVNNADEATKSVKKNPNWQGAGTYVVEGLDSFKNQLLLIHYDSDGGIQNTKPLTKGSDELSAWQKAYMKFTFKKIKFTGPTLEPAKQAPTKEVSSSPF